MALEFNHVDEVINFGDILNFEKDDPFSFSIWINTTYDTGYPTIFAKRTTAGNIVRGYNAYLRQTTGFFGFFLKNAEANGIEVWGTDTDVTDGTDRCLIVTYDGSEDAVGVILYVDGVAEAKNTAFDNLTLTTISSQALCLAAFYNVTIPVYQQFFGGKAWGFRAYNRVLSLVEAKIITAAKGADNIVDGLVSRWLLNEQPDGTDAAGANSIIDVSGQGYHGSPVNDPDYRPAAVRLIRPPVSTGIKTL